RERFGDVDGVVAELHAIDRTREQRLSRAEWLADLGRDFRFAFRSLRRTPAFAATAVLTLALAIAANTTIFSFVHALLLDPLPYRRPQELVRVSAQIIGSTGEMLALRERATVFSELGLYRTRSITLNDDRDATRVDGAVITANLLGTLGVAPAIGTRFTENADGRGAGRVILLSHALWMERYGGDRNIVNRQVTVDGTPYSIIGVMPPRFHFPSVTTRFWIPATIDPANITGTWAIGGAQFVARLKPGISPERATAEMKAVLPGMRRLNPRWDPGDQYGSAADAAPLQQSLVANERPALRLLFGCVAVVLLVACVNLANLMLARVTAREREFTVRAALGGGRSRLIRQLLTESVAIASLGGGLGFVLAIGGVRWATAALPPTMTRTADVQLNGVVFAFTAGVAILTGIVFGLLPAFRAAAVGSRLGRTFGGGRAQHRLSSALVAAEVALAVVLVIVAGLLTRSFAELRGLSPGFRTEHVVSARISPPFATYRDTARVTSFYASLLAQVSALPGVSSVGLVDQLPIARTVFGMGMRVQGQFEDGTQLLPSANHM
ncbi:MAG: ABC transporter permease, partial [bacterium]